MQDPSLEADNTPVTVVVTRHIKPGCETAYEDWLHGVGGEARKFTGHLGLNVIRPTHPGLPEYVLIFRFDRYSNLKRWIDSEVRASWMAKAEPLAQSAPNVQLLTGMESFFSLPGRPSPAPPKRYKMMVLTFVALFPLINLLSYLLMPLLQPLPPLLRSLCLIVAVIPLMTYVIMPQLTRLAYRWLYAS